jgi:hypothetical protein
VEGNFSAFPSFRSSYPSPPATKNGNVGCSARDGEGFRGAWGAFIFLFLDREADGRTVLCIPRLIRLAFEMPKNLLSSIIKIRLETGLDSPNYQLK